MSSTTPNLGLTLWDSPSDTFNSQQLVENFQAIDDDYNRTRPTDRAELLTSLPGSGNFNGRLVYLTVASGGFSAGTLVRYQGASWGAVGPLEVLGAIPASGNYAGRLVLLSAASGSFEAWTLIRYDGAGWATANRSYELLSAVPTSNNFAGRLVMLTSNDSGFKAYDLIRFDGSAWARIGPQPVPPGTELVYFSQTTDATTTNIVDPGDTLTTFSGATYENVKHYFQISIPLLYHSVADTSISFRLRESTTGIGNPVTFHTHGAGRGQSVNALLPFTPTAAAHTYNVTWWSANAGTATIKTTGLVPATFRIFKA